MSKVVHRASERGVGQYGWLTTRYSFSFADWFEPSRMGFRKLRVINDDIVAPASGFGEHSHCDMEIITIVMKGAVTHRDSVGGEGIVRAGEVQVMSAGSGVTHSEYNKSKTEPLELFQIWIETRDRGITPRYGQRSFSECQDNNKLQYLVSPDVENLDGTLTIAQDAYIARANLAGENLRYVVKHQNNGVYIFIIDGEAEVLGETLGKRDAIGVTKTDEIVISTKKEGSVLIIEVSA